LREIFLRSFDPLRRDFMKLRLLLLGMFLAYVSIALATGWLQIILALTTAWIASIFIIRKEIRR
jgi:hypothetical protein